MEITIHKIEAGSVEKKLVNRFFKTHKQTPAGKLDVVFIAKQRQQIIGAVRLEQHDHYYWLRNLFVLPEFRNQTIGSQLAKTCQTFQPVYLFPHTHLLRFYQNLGYELIQAEDLPESLRQKYQTYLNNGKDFLAMRGRGCF